MNRYAALRLWGSACLALCLSACGGAGDTARQVGPDPQLPEVNETLLPPMKIAKPADWEGELPSVPEGFVITALATDLKIPRQTLVLPNGDILVAEGAGGSAPKLRPKDVVAGHIKDRGKTDAEGGDRITLLRDADGDGQAEVKTTFIDGLNAPYGLALIGDTLYVANQDALLRFTYTPGAIRLRGGVEVTKLPSKVNHHWTKALAASADGTRLYVGIGSNSNVGERGLDIEEERAVIWEIDPTTGARRTVATGIRNPTALAIEPQTGQLWAVVNERDELGPDLVPDYLTAVQDGAFYGWPYSYWGQNVDPRVRPQKPELVKVAVRPDYALGSHVAPLGLAFVSGERFPAPYEQGAFVGQHGSWNRQELSGYKVVWVPFANGKPSGPPQDFVTGFITKNGRARGRPVGVTYDAERGRLLIADDLFNAVWLVRAVGGAAAKQAKAAE